MGKKGEEVSCPSCGTSKKTNSEISLSEKVEKVQEKEVVNKDNAEEIHPTTPEECPRCKHPESYYWTKQTRAGDEPETQFFKCVNCKHQWRDYK